MINLEVELSDSYHFEKINDESYLVNFKVPKNLSYFKGHFPQFPVMPAVAQIDITHYFIKKLILKSDIALKKIDYIKIKAAVQPEQQVSLNIVKLNDSTFRTNWITTDTEQKDIAELTILF